MPDTQEPSVTKNRTALTAAVILGVVILGWWLFSRGRGGERVDLIAQFESAVKRPSAEMLALEEVTLNGESKRSIVTKPGAGTRLTYKVRVPDDGWFYVSLGVKPEAWEQEGDGVYFMVGISDGRAYDQLFSEHVNPHGDPTSRRWIPVWVDISAYAGEEIELILNTRPGPPRQEDDDRNDLGVWGEPQIVVR